jgi:bacillithiol synthase
VRLPVDIRRFSWIRRLAIDYAYHFERLAPFFAGDPRDRSRWPAIISRVQAHTRSRADVVRILRAQQQARGAPPEALAAADRLADPRSVAVVTGQQAGLFGGPLFTLLKALTTVRLAEQTAADYGVPAVALFWIDSEDHDWEEVRSCRVLDAELRPRRIVLPEPPGAGDLPVAAIRLDGAIAAAVDELGDASARTEFTADLIAQLRRAYAVGVGMAEGFGRWLETLLGSRGLIVFDCSDPAAKPLVRDLFARELGEPGRTAALAAGAGHALKARDYHAQVTPLAESVALFHLNGGRHPIRWRANQFRVGEKVVPADALISEVMSRPERFSPNVLLRPLVQDSLFPTICYVGGPSELAYLAQLKDVYAHFGLPMPLIYPRATATLLDSATLRFLTRYDLPVEALQPQDEGALNRLLEAQLPRFVEQSLHDAHRMVQESMNRVIQAVPAIDPTLEGAARSTVGRMEHDLRTLHSKIIQAAKRRDDTLRRQFARARAQAFPEGAPQERALGFVYFLNRYGPALVDRLMADLPLDLGVHWVLTI